MSGSVELKINGILIGNVYYHNEGYLDDSTCAYSYEYHSWPESDAIKGKLIHVRPEGVEKLILLVFKDILKQKAG